MDKFLRVLAVLSSVILMIGFVWYRSTAVASNGEVLSKTKVLPSSKVGTAIDIYSTDWSGKYPDPVAKTPKFSVSPAPGGWTPSPSETPFSILHREALMQSSKSGQIVLPETPDDAPILSPSPSPLVRATP